MAVFRGKVKRSAFIIVLGGYVSAQLIHQHTHQLVVTVERSIVKRGAAVLVHSCHAGAKLLHQYSCCLMVAVESSAVKRRAVIVVLGGYVSAQLVHKDAGSGALPLSAGFDQCLVRVASARRNERSGLVIMILTVKNCSQRRNKTPL